MRPLLDELGFAGLAQARATSIDGKEYAISHEWGASVAVHLLGARVPIDRRSPRVPGAAKSSPHGLVQEFLNRSDAHLWAVVSNGHTLRLLRDNASLTRQAYVEFDLQAIFEGELYSDFACLWLSCHRTRFEGDPPATCLLERWSHHAATSGTRALDRLRDGVEAAIQSLGEGFLTHPANGDLRQRLTDGSLTTAEYQRQLLRVVYRLLFLLVAESRDLLLAPGTDEQTRARYREHYSVQRIARLARVRRGSTHDDLWAGLQVTISALWRDGEPALGLSALGSFLWSPASTAALSEARLDNAHLLEAVRRLTLTRDAEAKTDRTVDYRNLGAEELGSIYESLLELHAQVDVAARTFALGSAAGNERKTTGSYYTPTSLINELLDSALDPVLDEAASSADPEAAILGLSVLDPACGSGHFLIAAANRIAQRLASVRAGGIEPAPDQVRTALRDVVGRCLHGIDINPMAVELCKVSLWLEATEPGKPLSFLDHRIVCGNGLLGTTPRLLADGIPDEAFQALAGDDKTIVNALKKKNKKERAGQATLSLIDDSVASAADPVAAAIAAIDALPDSTAPQVTRKSELFAELEQSPEAARARLSADAWCAAFVAPKSSGEPPITSATVRDILDHTRPVSADVVERVRSLADEFGFLHPHLAFPDVISVPDDLDDATNSRTGWSGGFSVVLGNPPWDMVQLSEKEFFAGRQPEIAEAAGATRKRLVAKLEVEDPGLFHAYATELRHVDGLRHFLGKSGRFPLCGRGKINTYSVFAETMRDATGPAGRVGVIVPSGIATDDTTKFFFQDIVERRNLASLFDFENRNAIFPGVHRSYKFCLLTLAGDERPVDEAEFVFFALDTADLNDPERRFTLTPEDFALLNPNTRTCPIFRTRRDAEITKGIYRRVPVLVEEGPPEKNPWGVTFRQGLFNMTSDSHLFRTREQLEADGWTLRGNIFTKGDDRYLPLYEAKMVDFFDHRAADVVLSKTAAVRQGQPSPS
ncbi:MAG: N-6 DNA methylase [Acidimicrobiales bacterium]